MEDVVYLKNGSIIRGVITEQVPNQSVKIQTRDRNLFVFKYDEIEKITKENIPVENLTKGSKGTEFKKKGFINLTEINYCHGIGSVYVQDYYEKSDAYSFGFRTVSGYQFNEHLSLGIGVGIDKYNNATYLPITFDVRATILKGKVSPVFAASIGYAVGSNTINYGLFINPQIGFKTYISKNVAYLFNVGLKWQEQDVLIYTYRSVDARSELFEYITISTGFSF